MLAFKSFHRKYYRYSIISVTCISVFIMPFDTIGQEINIFLKIKDIHLTYYVSLSYPRIKVKWQWGQMVFCSPGTIVGGRWVLLFTRQVGCRTCQRAGDLGVIRAQGQAARQAAFTYLAPSRCLADPLLWESQPLTLWQGQHLGLSCRLCCGRPTPQTVFFRERFPIQGPHSPQQVNSYLLNLSEETLACNLPAQICCLI